MLTLRARTDHVLVLGPSRSQERSELFVLVAGLFGFGMVLAVRSSGQAVHPVLVVASLVFAILAGAGLFFQERLIVDRRRTTLSYRSFTGRRKTCLISDIESVEIITAWSRYQECKVVLKDGSRLIVARSRVDELTWLGQTLATFLRVSLITRQIA
jgi:hypothetical protein